MQSADCFGLRWPNVTYSKELCFYLFYQAVDQTYSKESNFNNNIYTSYYFMAWWQSTIQQVPTEAQLYIYFITILIV